jgi:hypothetical protein
MNAHPDGYFARITDGTFWLVRWVGHAPALAVGPLVPQDMEAHPASADFSRAVDASAWPAGDLVPTSAAFARLIVDRGARLIMPKGNRSALAVAITEGRPPDTREHCCGYFRRKVDGTLWAVRLTDGKPMRAAGPLSGAEMNRHPMCHPARIDARAWRAVDFEAVGIRHQVTLVGAGDAARN